MMRNDNRKFEDRNRMILKRGGKSSRKWSKKKRLQKRRVLQGRGSQIIVRDARFRALSRRDERGQKRKTDVYL